MTTKSAAFLNPTYQIFEGDRCFVICECDRGLVFVVKKSDRACVVRSEKVRSLVE